MSSPWTPTTKQAAVLAALRTRPRALAAVVAGLAGGKGDE